MISVRRRVARRPEAHVLVQSVPQVEGRRRAVRPAQARAGRQVVDVIAVAAVPAPLEDEVEVPAALGAQRRARRQFLRQAARVLAQALAEVADAPELQGDAGPRDSLQGGLEDAVDRRPAALRMQHLYTPADRHPGTGRSGAVDADHGGTGRGGEMRRPGVVGDDDAASRSTAA
ncbi:MAG: hypothetical protein U1F06_07550 [Steroidobacteraceae bacterium]